MNCSEQALQLLRPEAAEMVPLGSRRWTRTIERKERSGVVVTDRLTKLPNTRGPSFVSQRPAGVDLADIASDQFHHVSLPSAFNSESLALCSN